MDEPTTALDSETKEEIVSLIKKLREKLGFYLIFVTHELGLAKKLCEQIMVIGDGKIIEFGEAKELFGAPKSEYTKRLLAADFNGREFRK
jgi:ABC-type dipeptide/oligopeptide/nickel transport system ATPase component